MYFRRLLEEYIARQCELCVSMMLCVCLGDCWRNDIARQCELCVSMMLCMYCWRNSIGDQYVGMFRNDIA